MERILTTPQSKETDNWPDSPAKHAIQLGTCFWEAGDFDKAREIFASVVPESGYDRFVLGLNRSILESENLQLSTALLDSIEPLIESVDPSRRGRCLLQRGYLLRRAKETDRAIIAYTESAYWFEIAGDSTFLAATTNNLASIFSDLGDFEQAHKCVERAIASFIRLEADDYLAQARDQQGRICLAEAKILTEKGQHLKAFQRLDQIETLDREFLFDIAKERMKVAENMLATCDIARIELALQESHGSFRLAASKLEITHPTLSKMIKNYGLKWTGNKPQRKSF